MLQYSTVLDLGNSHVPAGPVRVKFAHNGTECVCARACVCVCPVESTILPSPAEKGSMRESFDLRVLYVNIKEQCMAVWVD